VQQEHPLSQACPEAPQDEQEQSPMMTVVCLSLAQSYMFLSFFDLNTVLYFGR
jgi:hypothetical protein